MPKILVIEDDGAIAELIRIKLERSGFEVLLARDGLEGLEALKNFRPDLIILDILLPRMDGFQFYKKMKEDEKSAHIPVLVMTGRSAMRDSFETLGVESFLAKPFEPDQLLVQVQSILTASSKGEKPSPERGIKTALLAGADPKRLEVMKRQLQDKGYQVTLSTDGVHALGKALQILPDLFAVQLDMPQMNADEIIKVLNNYPDAKKISLVVYSLLAEKEKTIGSEWGRFVSFDDKKEIREKEVPIMIDDKFDAKSFWDKIKDFI